MKRFIRFLCAVLPFFAAEAIQYITVNLLLLIRVELTTEVQYLYSMIGILMSGIVFLYWYLYEIQGEVSVRFQSVLTVKNIGSLLMLGISCQLFFSGLMSLLVPYLKNLFQEYSYVVDRLTSGNYVFVLLLVIIVAPVTEELIFRGVILHLARRQVTFVGANLLQALLFGIYHGNLVQGIYAALIGFLLGLIYNKFKSIFASILLHIFINASAYLVILIPDTKLYYSVMLIAGGVLIAVALWILKLHKGNTLLLATVDTINN